jgi:DNA mismatch repair protein MutL
MADYPTFPEPARLDGLSSVGGDPWQLASAPASERFAYVVAEAGGAALAETSEPLFGKQSFYGQLRFIGQVNAMFLVAEGPDGMYVLDQHAAAERVTFERLRADYGKKHVASQRLLVPEVVAVTPEEHALLEEHADEVMGLGLEVRVLSGSSVAVHAVPNVLSRAHPERLVRDLVAEVGRASKRPFRDAVDLVLATMACHGSVRAGDVLSPDEAKALLDALDDVEFAGHCPHGRPVVMRLAWEELERRVGR